MTFPMICAGKLLATHITLDSTFENNLFLGSRYFDGFHHLHDVIFGSLIGVFVGYFVFVSMVVRPITKESKSKQNVRF